MLVECLRRTPGTQTMLSAYWNFIITGRGIPTLVSRIAFALLFPKEKAIAGFAMNTNNKQAIMRGSGGSCTRDYISSNLAMSSLNAREVPSVAQTRIISSPTTSGTLCVAKSSLRNETTSCQPISMPAVRRSPPQVQLARPKQDTMLSSRCCRCTFMQPTALTY
jgi:hypothetical protein